MLNSLALLCVFCHKNLHFFLLRRRCHCHQSCGFNFEDWKLYRTNEWLNRSADISLFRVSYHNCWCLCSRLRFKRDVKSLQLKWKTQINKSANWMLNDEREWSRSIIFTCATRSSRWRRDECIDFEFIFPGYTTTALFCLLSHQNSRAWKLIVQHKSIVYIEIRRFSLLLIGLNKFDYDGRGRLRLPDRISAPLHRLQPLHRVFVRFSF